MIDEPQVLVTDWKLGKALDGIDAARIFAGWARP